MGPILKLCDSELPGIFDDAPFVRAKLATGVVRHGVLRKSGPDVLKPYLCQFCTSK